MITCWAPVIQIGRFTRINSLNLEASYLNLEASYLNLEASYLYCDIMFVLHRFDIIMD